MQTSAPIKAISRIGMIDMIQVATVSDSPANKNLNDFSCILVLWNHLFEFTIDTISIKINIGSKTATTR